MALERIERTFEYCWKSKVLRKPAGSTHLTNLAHLAVHTDQLGEVVLADSEMH